MVGQCLPQYAASTGSLHWLLACHPPLLLKDHPWRQSIYRMASWRLDLICGTHPKRMIQDIKHEQTSLGHVATICSSILSDTQYTVLAKTSSASAIIIVQLAPLFGFCVVSHHTACTQHLILYSSVELLPQRHDPIPKLYNADNAARISFPSLWLSAICSCGLKTKSPGELEVPACYLMEHNANADCKRWLSL